MNFVYVIGHVGGAEEEDIKAPVKVGASDDPLKRLRSLQTGNPHPLALHMSIRAPNAAGAERDLHTMLVPHRMCGEWFNVSPWDVLDKIAEMAGIATTTTPTCGSTAAESEMPEQAVLIDPSLGEDTNIPNLPGYKAMPKTPDMVLPHAQPKITPEMLEAGAFVLRGLQTTTRFEDDWAEEVYLAMAANAPAAVTDDICPACGHRLKPLARETEG